MTKEPKNKRKFARDSLFLIYNINIYRQYKIQKQNFLELFDFLKFTNRFQ